MSYLLSLILSKIINTAIPTESCFTEIPQHNQEIINLLFPVTPPPPLLHHNLLPPTTCTQKPPLCNDRNTSWSDLRHPPSKHPLYVSRSKTSNNRISKDKKFLSFSSSSRQRNSASPGSFPGQINWIQVREKASDALRALGRRYWCLVINWLFLSSNWCFWEDAKILFLQTGRTCYLLILFCGRGIWLRCVFFLVRLSEWRCTRRLVSFLHALGRRYWRLVMCWFFLSSY